MTPEEFLEKFGPPRDARPVTAAQVANASGRLPESLLNFWRQHGIGSYADGNYRLCTPDDFDGVLDQLLANVPQLAGRLAAFGYESTGQVDLWHQDARIFTLLLPDAWIIDETSLTETAPVPYYLAELYAAAGVPMPEDAEDAAAPYLAAREEPEDIWHHLFSAASPDGYRHDIGDDGKSLPRALLLLHGPLAQGEIYSQIPGEIENIASSFHKVPLDQVFAHLPDTVTVTRTIEQNGAAQEERHVYPVGR